MPGGSYSVSISQDLYCMPAGSSCAYIHNADRQTVHYIETLHAMSYFSATQSIGACLRKYKWYRHISHRNTSALFTCAGDVVRYIRLYLSVYSGAGMQ